jgi:hypothetical protein
MFSEEIKMKINREELLQALKKIKPGIAKKDIVEQTTHFIFTGLEVITFNDSISIKYPLKTDFKCSVPAEDFFKIISELDCENLELKLKESILHFETGKAKVKMPVSLEINKSLLVKENDKWKDLPEDFIDAISFCLFSAAKDMTKIVLTYIDIKGDIVSSSDNYRITQYQMKKKLGSPILISAEAVQELIKFKIKKYSLTDSWTFFSTKDGIIFSCKRISETFPDLTRILNMVEGQKIKFAKETQKAVQISSIFAEGNFDIDRKIKVKIENGKLTCIGEKQSGRVEFCVDSPTMKNKEIEFTINPEFFLKILSSCSNAIVGKGKITFISDNFKHLISLF